MSYLFYKWLHLTSLLIMVLTTGVLLSSAFAAPLNARVRKSLAIIHGVSLAVVLVAGFGLLARAQIDGAFTTLWFNFKLIAWLLFGMTPLFIKRLPAKHQPKLFGFFAALLTLTVYLVVNKPA